MLPLISIIQSTDRLTPHTGKTTFARALYEALGPAHVTYLTHDSYYKDLSHLPHQERAKANFDHPNALDTALLVEHVRRLKCVRVCVWSAVGGLGVLAVRPKPNPTGLDPPIT